MSLVDLASQKKLPPQQYLDYETVSWIKKSAVFPKSYDLTANAQIALPAVKKYIPNIAWFSPSARADTLHGIRHLLRVTAYASILNALYGNNSSKEVLCTAASLHDLKRENDQQDEGHAQRSAEWFVRNKAVVQKQYLTIFHTDQTTKIKNLIENHELTTQDNLQLQLLKTADALDRYIQPKKKWWMDESVLTIKPSEELKFFAYNTVVLSEEKFLQGNSSVESVTLTLEEFSNAY